MSPPDLRPYQARALDDLGVAWVRLHRTTVGPRILLVSRTGTGKSVIAAHFLARVMAKGRTAAFVVRDRCLIDQMSAHLDKHGLKDHGVIAAGHPRKRPDMPLQICSAQTLTSRGERPAADVLCFDEAHGIVCETSLAIVAAYPDATMIGLTASPERSDKKPMGDVFQALVQVKVPFADLVAQGALVDVDVFSPNESVAKLAEDPIAALRRHAPRGSRHKAVIFGADTVHGRALALAAKAAGYRAEDVNGRMKDAERAERLVRFALPVSDPRALDVLTNCDLLTQGWDCPPADVGIIARGVSSWSAYIQICGRFLRPYPGKLRAQIVDLRGNFWLHGHPAGDRVFTLDKSESQKGRAALEALPPCVCCPSCLAWSSRRPCPACGAEMPAPPPPKVLQRELVLQRGDQAARRDASAAASAWIEWCDFVQARRKAGKSPQAIAYAWKMSGRVLRYRVDQVPAAGYQPVLSAVGRGRAAARPEGRASA